MRFDLWFDRRIDASGGATIEVCAAVLLFIFTPRLTSAESSAHHVTSL
jgi:hypothetical protein